MSNHSLLTTACVCATVLTGVTMVARGGNLSPNPGPISPTMLTLADLAALSTPVTDGTGNNYFCTKDGIVNPGSIPMGGSTGGLPSFGSSPDIPGSATATGREGQIEIDSIQEQVIIDDAGRTVHKPLRLRVKRDQSIIALLNKIKIQEMVGLMGLG